MVYQKLTSATKYVPRTPFNINKDEYKALVDLKQTSEITIKSCDKGGGIAVLNTLMYISKMEEMLNDTKFYVKINKNPTDNIKGRIQRLSNKALREGHICDKEHAYMNIQHPIMASLYGVPKIHKSEINPPFRPIVTTIGSITEPVSKYLDAILCPHVNYTPAYVQDTRHIINLMQGTPFNPELQWLVTLDIESLYSNIPIQGAIQAVKWFI